MTQQMPTPKPSGSGNSSSSTTDRADAILRHVFPNIEMVSQAIGGVAASASGSSPSHDWDMHTPAARTHRPKISLVDGISAIPVDEPTSEMLETDFLIVGGGIVGPAMAHALSQKGFRSIVVERDWTEPDRIVGELMQPGGVKALELLGLLDTVENIDADTIQGYSVFFGDEKVRLKYPVYKGYPKTGKSFHHGRFVMQLRRAARAAKLVTLFQGTVTQLLKSPATAGASPQEERIIGGVFKNGLSGKVHRILASMTVVCDGSSSLFRRDVSDAESVVRSHFVGIIMHGANDKLPFPHHGHVVLAKPSPVLCYPISSECVRVLVDIPGSTLPSVANGDMARHLTAFVAPQLPAEFQGSFLEAVEKGRVRSMPNKQLHPKPYHVRGAILLGDCFNGRHPLTGGGMTVALWDVYYMTNLLSRYARRGSSWILGSSVLDVPALCANSRRLDRMMKEFFRQRRPLASTINILAGALYSVFSATDDPSLPVMQKACFDYFKLGGIAVTGPMSLLSGMNPSPATLIFHFFSVAVFGSLQALKPFPTLGRLLLAIRVVLAANRIVQPLMRKELGITWDPCKYQGKKDY